MESKRQRSQPRSENQVVCQTISRLGLCRVDTCTVGQDGQFEVDSFCYSEPMEVSKRLSDVICTTISIFHSGGSIENRLQTIIETH